MANACVHGHQGNRLLAAVPAEVLAGLHLKHVSLAQGSVMFEPGAELDTIYFPQTALASLLIVTRDGGSIEASTVGREGAVGLHGALGKRRSFTRATTQIGGLFSVVPSSRFEQVAQDTHALRALIAEYTELLWAEAQQIAACNAMHGARSRLCRWLLQSADKLGTDQLALTQELLAQMIGVRRTTVTLLAHNMQNGGLIKYARGHITLIDRARLEACACECYHVLHHQKLPHALGVSFSPQLRS